VDTQDTSIELSDEDLLLTVLRVEKPRTIYVCSHCRVEWEMPYESPYENFIFCPGCGEKMKLPR